MSAPEEIWRGQYCGDSSFGRNDRMEELALKIELAEFKFNGMNMMRCECTVKCLTTVISAGILSQSTLGK